MSVKFQIPIEFSKTIYNAKKCLKYVNEFSVNMELKEYLLSNLIRELNNLKSVEFKIEEYPKKEKFYKTKHQLETKINELILWNY